MATTFNLELNNRPSKNKTYVVLLRITQNKKHKRIKTSIELKSKKDFNPKAKQGNWVRSSEPNFKVWNEELEKELEKAKQTYRDLKIDGLATKEIIISTMISEEKTSSFLQYAKDRTKELDKAGNYRNYKKYNGFCNKLEAFLANKNGNIRDLTFAELTPSLLSKFESFLKSLNNERQPDKKLHPNTIAINFNIFKTLVNRAITIDGYLKIEKNPFNVFNYKGTKTLKEKLNEEEIKKIEEATPVIDSPEWHSKNCFLFSFYCAGIRAGDLIQLRWRNITPNGRIEYEMGKNHKFRNIMLIQKAKDILALYKTEESKNNDYIFPLLDSSAIYAKAIMQSEKDILSPELKKKLLSQVSSKNAYLNKYLKILGKTIGIEKNLSMHIARHSFARKAKDKEVDNGIVKGILAHENSKTTDVYMGDFETSVYDEAMMKIFGEDNNTDKIIEQIKNMNSEQKDAILKILQSNG